MISGGTPSGHRRIRSFFKQYVSRICGACVAHVCPWPWDASAAVGVATFSLRAGASDGGVCALRGWSGGKGDYALGRMYDTRSLLRGGIPSHVVSSTSTLMRISPPPCHRDAA